MVRQNANNVVKVVVKVGCAVVSVTDLSSRNYERNRTAIEGNLSQSYASRGLSPVAIVVVVAEWRNGIKTRCLPVRKRAIAMIFHSRTTLECEFAVAHRARRDHSHCAVWKVAPSLNSV